MDATRFDALARSLLALSSRRGLIGGGLSGLLALAASDPTGARKRKKKCKKKCAECHKCKKGKCKPQPDGTSCGSGGRVCQGEACDCPPGEQDSDGVCGTPPTCLGAIESCTPLGPNDDCCSGVCSQIAGVEACLPSEIGDPCSTSADCADNPQIICRGFVCVAP